MVACLRLAYDSASSHLSPLFVHATKRTARRPACHRDAAMVCPSSYGPCFPQHLQVRLASVRRSLFASDPDRFRFLNRLVAGTRDILRMKQGLQEHENFHELCRLLGRLKTNFQLAELVSQNNRSLMCACDLVVCACM